MISILLVQECCLCHHFCLNVSQSRNHTWQSLSHYFHHVPGQTLPWISVLEWTVKVLRLLQAPGTGFSAVLIPVYAFWSLLPPRSPVQTNTNLDNANTETLGLSPNTDHYWDPEQEQQMSPAPVSPSRNTSSFSELHTGMEGQPHSASTAHQTLAPLSFP